VYRLGSGDAQIVAIHGITASSRAWLAVARALEGRAELLAVDLRGRGRSSALPAPYGIGAHARDLIAVLNHFGLERTVVVGHSLGAYVATRLAVEHPDRVSALVLADGGLTLPGLELADPQAVLEAALGPALARLKMTFPTREAYRDWWRRHPAFAASDIADADIVAYADHDLVGDPPRLRSTVSEDAVRGDAAELFEWGEPAKRLTIPAHLLCAPRGLLNDANPMQPLEVVRAWVQQAPELRQATQVPDRNHYELVMGTTGSAQVADAVAEAIA